MSNDNRRSEPRLSESMTVFVELRAENPEDQTPAEILVCTGVDFSANGLKLHLDRPLPAGSIFRLGAAPKCGTPVMYVVGEVRWAQRTETGYTVGFSFFDSEGTDIVAWKRFMVGRLSD